MTPKFILVFATVATITLLSGGTALWLSQQDPLSPEASRILETSTTTWNLGVGILFGLIGKPKED